MFMLSSYLHASKEEEGLKVFSMVDDFPPACGVA